MRPYPELIETYWRALDWEVEALWALDLPTQTFPIARLEWHLDVPLWHFDGERYVITPRDVVKSPNRYAAEYRRTQQSNLVFPIEITHFKRRWLILDGVHRLLKAHELGHDEMLVRKVPPKLLTRVAEPQARA